eukprot:CAMPEP_0202862950 /NCGR_PEP_ID=MMETSP1391-20130828/3793_1 /ASSEMBLY_ACC=CAM_ASM_000867 /TAXON_ID=1034604 /ORGANISM="Chlamydomonas leiostraca, Strain SAG 11-49" /LENGTH=262 /DNA_ID=CAMNT_0049542545 /DNA_START=239 /DNA_END=1027 /DNA_ORIENTATION=-
MTLATGVATSPVRYSIMRSAAPRFPHNHTQSVPFGVYNTDTLQKKTLESWARDNTRFYSASFQSKGERFSRPWTSPATDALYDVERLKNSAPATLARCLDWSPQNYAILRSRYKRFNDKPAGEGPDVMYDTDVLHKASLATAVARSPLSYKMATPTAKLAQERASPELGPGAYTSKHWREVRVSEYLDARPLSSMASRTPRFGGKHGATGGLGLGTTWSAEKDTAAWAKRGVSIAKTEYLRPQYLPKAYMSAGAGGKGEKGK